MIDLRGNLVNTVLYNGNASTIPIILRLSRNPLRLSASLVKVTKTFIIGDGSSLTISDDYGAIPFRLFGISGNPSDIYTLCFIPCLSEIERFVSNHDEGVDIPLCFVMSSFFIAVFGSLLYFIKTNDTDWRKHNKYLQKLDYDRGKLLSMMSKFSIHQDEGLFRIKPVSPKPKTNYRHKLGNRMGNISESLSLTSKSRMESSPNRLSVSYTRLRNQGQIRNVIERFFKQQTKTRVWSPPTQARQHPRCCLIVVNKI